MTDEDDDGPTLTLHGSEIESGDKISCNQNGGTAVYEFTGDYTDRNTGVFIGRNRRALTVAEFTQNWLQSRDVSWVGDKKSEEDGSEVEQEKELDEDDEMTPEEAVEKLLTEDELDNPEKVQEVLEDFEGPIPGAPPTPEDSEESDVSWP